MASFSILNMIESEIKSGLKCERIAFPGSSFNKLYAYQFSKSNSANRVVHGLGVDLNEKKAIIKGFVEFHERNAFFDIGVANGFTSTNGIAGHRFYLLARNSAIAEITERDSLLMHWYSETPFKHIKSPKIFDSYKLSLARDGYEILFVVTTLGFSKTTVCFLINKKTLGFVIGLSSGRSEVDDSQKAFTEALVNLHFGGYGKSIDEQQHDLLTNGLTSLTNHRCYWLYKSTLPSWVLENLEYQLKSSKAAAPEVTEIFHKKHGSVHIVGVAVSNSFNLELGYPSKETVSLLSTRLEKKYNYDKIEAHPIP